MKRFFVKVWHGIRAVQHAIGWVLTQVLMAAMFYLVFAPVGLVMRWVLRRDPMKRHLDPAASTYWEDHPKPLAGRERYEHPY